MSTCRSCGATIRWAVTEKGKRIPLDADPSPRGNMRLGPDGTAINIGSGTEPSLFSEQGVDLFMPHHATCPSAGEWRRK